MNPDILHQLNGATAKALMPNPEVVQKMHILDHCNVTECYHHIILPYYENQASKAPVYKCQCSSTVEGRTGEVGCPGMRERMMNKNAV
jgi:hypothetical protein